MLFADLQYFVSALEYFIMYNKNRNVVKATSGIQTKTQVISVLDKKSTTVHA
jgi:hypothetical protein